MHPLQGRLVLMDKRDRPDRQVHLSQVVPDLLVVDQRVQLVIQVVQAQLARQVRVLQDLLDQEEVLDQPAHLDLILFCQVDSLKVQPLDPLATFKVPCSCPSPCLEVVVEVEVLNQQVMAVVVAAEEVSPC